MTFEAKLINGGSVSYQPAGVYKEEGKEDYPYTEKIVVMYAGTKYKIPPRLAAVLYQAIRDNKDIQAFLGVKSGLL